CQVITVTNPANAAGTINVPFSETFTQSGAIGSATFTTASTLPAGLTLAPNGVLSGTPTQTGTFPITVTVTDANGCTGTSATYTLIIACQTITVTNPSNANGTVGTLFSETFTQSGANGTPTFTLASGTLPAGITLSSAGVLSGTPTQAGNFPITVTVTDSNGCTGTSATYTLVIACQTITVNNPANANGTVGTAFSETFTQTGGIGTVTYSTSSTLPAGITLNGATGVLSGTPTEDGTFPITVVATDANGCTGTSSTYNLTIVCQTITVTNPANSAGTVDAAFSETFTNTGAIGAVTYTLASGTLPSGLTLAANGTLSGTPGQPGNFPITVMVTDVNGCTGTSATYTLVIACQTITVTNPATSAAVYNAPFSQTFTQSGVGTHTPAVWSVTGTLPAGITLNTSTGVLSGTPTQTGTFPITVTVTDVNGCAGTGPTYNLAVAPVAVADSFSNAVGNTQYVLTGGTTATPSTPTIQIAGTIEVNDLPSAATVTVVAGTFSTTNGGSVTIASDGTFLYTPPAQPGVAPSPTDTFTYNVTSDTGSTGTPVTSAPGTVTINLANRVWYVKNDAPAGGNGRSTEPFDTLAEAQTASTANDIIYVYFGNGTNSGQNSGFVMKAGQKLYGQGIALVVNTQTLVAAGSQPLIGNSAGDGVTATNLTGNIIRGLNITGSDDGIFMTTTGASAGDIEIADNTVAGTASFGVRIATGSTNTANLSIHDNTLSGAAGAMDITRTSGITTITAFDDNVVPGTSAGGIVVTGTGGVITFDATPGGAIQAVSGGATLIGTSVDRISNTGLALLNVAGTLTFTDLDIFTDANAALIADGGTGGFTLTVAPTAATIVANAGGAVALTDITALDLQLAAMTSTNSASEGVSLVNVTGTFSAPLGSTITNATGTDFFISGGTVNSTYNGTITDDLGTLVSIVNGTGGTKSFTGLISDGFDGDGSGISISGNNASTIIGFSGGLSLATGNNAAFTATGAGTLTITDPAGATANRISTLNGTALSVSGGVQIGASGLTFESISVDGNDTLPTNGILLNGTGSAGGLVITGTGVANSGGTIRDTGDDGISLTNVAKISLSRMNITSNLGSGIFGNTVNGFVVADSSITANGDDAGADESGILISELSGTNGGAFPTSITGTTISNNFEFELSITNNGSAVLSNLTMSGNTISANGLQLNHGNLFNFLSFGTGSMTLNLTSGTFTGNTDTSGGKIVTATAVQCDHSGSGGTMTCNVSNATFTNNNVGPQASVASNGQMVIDFNNNNIQGSRAIGVNIFADANAPYTKTIQGRIRNNVIGTNGVPNSGSATGFPIRVQNEGRVNITLVIDNNDVFEAANAGINLNHGISSANGTGTSALTVINNSVTNITASRAIIMNQNDIIGGGAHGTVCVDISGNAFAGIAGQAGDGSIIRLREGAQTGGTATFNVRQLTPTAAANASELDDANGITAAQISISGTPTFNAGTCAQPIN
ncbi:MAG TPA: Ig domain-containing protein, partial [Thermoanaerobaculia bacterium]